MSLTSRAEAINAFGINIVSAESGEEWRRHRSVVRACFGEDIFENAWDQTIAAYSVMITGEHLEDGGVIKNAWRVLERVRMLNRPFQAYEQQLTLIVIAKAGFDMEMPWIEEDSHDDGEYSKLYVECLRMLISVL